jgi:superfamily II DNA or RNA helicase
MKYVLRDEQLLCASESSKALMKDRRTILNLGTGGGKTVTSTYMMERALKRRRVWVLCHREEIMWQFLETMIGFQLTPNIIGAGHKYLRGQRLYLGMIKTFQARGLITEVQKDDLVITDECHWGDYESTVSRLPCYVLGLSATPLSAGRPLNEYWGNCIAPVPMKWLIDNHRLVPGIAYSIDYDFSNLKISGRDYSERLLIEEFKNPKLFDGVVEQYLKHAAGEKAFCYNINIEHSLRVCKQFNDAGIRAAHIDGKTPRDLRRDYFKSFRAGYFDILCNVGIATTGTDEPSASTVIKNYCTTLLPKDKQCEGRMARPFPGKIVGKVIDMGRNYIRHGRYGIDEIDWIDVFQNPSNGRKTRGRDREKECKQCGAVIEMMAGTCPYCGISYTKEEVEKVFLQKADTIEIKDYRLAQLPPHIRNKPIPQMNYEELKIYAKTMNYSDSWPGLQMGLRKKYAQKKANRARKEGGP